jgi:hypothetical protein
MDSAHDSVTAAKGQVALKTREVLILLEAIGKTESSSKDRRLYFDAANNIRREINKVLKRT